jgi:hypothetical protein
LKGLLELRPIYHHSDERVPAQVFVAALALLAVDPRNNKKLDLDLLKLAGRAEEHRYLFFMSPRFPGFKRLPQWERNGIQV